MNGVFAKYCKHYIKEAIGIHDPSWLTYVFEHKVHPGTWENYASVLAWAEKCLAEKSHYETPEQYVHSDDPVVRQGYELKKKIEGQFKNLLVESGVRILVQVPDEKKWPGCYSLCYNFAEAFEFLGIPTQVLTGGESTAQALETFKPSVLLTNDNFDWLNKIDWHAVEKYRKRHTLHIGLTAGIVEYNGTPFREQMTWAKEHGVDFYYNWHYASFLHTFEGYRPFFDAGHEILSLPFGVNIGRYYPVPGIPRENTYVFLASSNRAKAPRYTEYLLPTVSKYPGIIAGPGWHRIHDFHFNRDRDRYLYARSKVGLNIHLQDQVDRGCEVNERTFMLAACGVPQVTDAAKLLPTLFSENALFVAHSPKEYTAYVETILKNPDIGCERALQAQREVFEKHTTLHRAHEFMSSLLTRVDV